MKKQAFFLLAFVGLTIAFVKEMTILIQGRGRPRPKHQTAPERGHSAYTQGGYSYELCRLFYGELRRRPRGPHHGDGDRDQRRKERL